MDHIGFNKNIESFIKRCYAYVEYICKVGWFIIAAGSRYQDTHNRNSFWLKSRGDSCLKELIKYGVHVAKIRAVLIHTCHSLQHTIVCIKLRISMLQYTPSTERRRLTAMQVPF